MTCLVIGYHENEQPGEKVKSAIEVSLYEDLQESYDADLFKSKQYCY